MHARLSELVTPFNAGFQLSPNVLLNPDTPEGAAMIDKLVTGQAVTISYQNDFLLMAMLALCCLPLILAFRGPKRAPAPAPAMAAADH